MLTIAAFSPPAVATGALRSTQRPLQELTTGTADDWNSYWSDDWFFQRPASAATLDSYRSQSTST